MAASSPAIAPDRRTPLGKDRLLAIGLLLPSLVAVAIFVYGFIGWSIRVSLSQWTGLIPDFTLVGLQQYPDLIQDRRFAIDVRNTAIFTVLFIVGCLVLGLGWRSCSTSGSKGRSDLPRHFPVPDVDLVHRPGVVWGWLMNPATGDRITGINLIFQKLNLDFLVSQWHRRPSRGAWHSR